MITAVRAFRARPRLLVSTLVAIAAAVLLPARFALSSRLLLAWDVGASLYLILAFVMMARSAVADMRRRAGSQDEGAIFISS
jgi:uncharacterized membrane protein